MRALLVVNSTATTTSSWVRDVIAKALSADLQLDVVDTKNRGHATHLTRGAVHEGVDLVVALGGDGTINEVLNGLAGTEVPLGIIPGGGTNVLCRSLGLPPDPVEATATLLQNLREGRRRTINLGQANERYFGFAAGLGFDAAVVQAVERRVHLRRTAKDSLFIYSVFQTYFGYPKRQPSIYAKFADGSTSEPLMMAVACNSNPFTYLGDHPMQLCPDADFDLGIDLAGITRLRPFYIVHLAVQTVTSTRHTRGKRFRYWRDLEEFSLSSDSPQHCQVDGDYVGERDCLRIRSVPNALTVIA
ncbi:MAG: diacylglycerol kinase family protein [Actinomycetota bacterium]